MTASLRPWSLAQLARRFGAEVAGDPAFEVHGVCALEPGDPAGLGFVADARHVDGLARCGAGALVMSPDHAAAWHGPALISRDPALVFARIARLFDDAEQMMPGRHPTAVIDARAKVHDSASIGAHAVIEDGATIAAGCFIGPGCVVRRGAVIGVGSRLEAQIYIGPRCRLGARGRLLPGAVIGARGFGLVRTASGWEEVPQMGAVCIGDDVEVGAHTSIDRGALDDTVIEEGVKLDNHIQIGHNCRIGAHTAIAACTGIAGSTRIGRRCMIGGAAGIGGHLIIGDDVVVLARAMVTKSLSGPGVYGSGLPVMPVRDWRRLIGRIRRLPNLESRLREIERIVEDPRNAKGVSGD